MRKTALLLGCLFCLLGSLLMTGALEAQQRFPRPEFETDYGQPHTTVPAPRASVWESLDVVLFAAAMALAAYLALYRRSRRGLLWLTIFSLAYFGFYREGCICPIGSLQNVSAALADPGVRLPLFVVALFLLPLIFALFFGRVFCAAVCPLGAAQELMMRNPRRVPPWLAELLGLLRYLYLGLAVLLAATGSMYAICQYDPFVGLFRLSGSSGMLLLGAAFLGLSVVIARPYCRFLCPYGVLLGWLSQLAARTVTTSPEQCVDCRLCEDCCPVGAIRRPTGEALPESRSVAVKRLATLLLLLPVVTVVSGWAVSRLDVVLSRTHSTVRLAERIQAEDAGAVTGTTLESRTFRAEGSSTEQLYQEAQVIRRQLRRGGWLLGAFLGLVIVLKLVGFSVWRSRGEYLPDAADCVACGRCFEYCPIEHTRLGHTPLTPLTPLTPPTVTTILAAPSSAKEVAHEHTEP